MPGTGTPSRTADGADRVPSNTADGDTASVTDGDTAPSTGDLPVTTFLSDDVRRADRFAYWCDLMSDAHAPMRLTSEHAEDFHARLRLVQLGAVIAWPSVFQPATFHRTPGCVRRCDPGTFHLSLVLSGTADVSWRRQQAGVRTLDYHTNDSSRAWDIRTNGRKMRSVGLEVPKASLPLPTAKAERAMGLPMTSRHGLGALLGTLLVQLARKDLMYGAADAPRLGSVIADLVAGMFANAVDAEGELEPQTRTRTLVLRIRAFIRQNLGDPTLTPTTVAAAHHISIGHLHRLFREEGTTVGALIRNLRLQHAHADLANPALRATPIHTIAATWGYPRPADFSRAFRTAYGLTPREHRNLSASSASAARGAAVGAEGPAR
ncbi:AraC family transcriptional regulator [Streptomyces sp. JNUCC 64]